MGRCLAVLWFVVLLVCSSSVVAQDDELDVPFVPTRMEIVPVLVSLGTGAGVCPIMTRPMNVVAPTNTVQKVPLNRR